MKSKVTTDKSQARSTTDDDYLGFYLPFFLVIAGIVYAVSSLAQPTGPDSLNPGTSERANLSNNASEVQAQAGNVTNINIDATAITKAWQGYYGNITGTITLEDSSGSVFYNWTGLGSISGEVFASRDSNVDWDTINCTNSSEISSENDFVGKDPSAPDSVNNTFNRQDHPEFLVGTRTIGNNTCPSTNAFSGGSKDTSRFYQVLLADNQSNIVYTTIIDQDQLGFDDNQYDFELLVGENGNATQDDTTTTYYFYIELS